MSTVPKSLRLHIAILGRANVGKSSFLNLVTGQAAAITSPVAGTTTDAVEKAMELPPIGPVLWIDTAGLDDQTQLGDLRAAAAGKVFDRAEAAVLLVTADEWGETEDKIISECRRRDIPVVIAVNRVDEQPPSAAFLEQLHAVTPQVMEISCQPGGDREDVLSKLTPALWAVLPESFTAPPPLLGDLVKAGDLVVMIVPIDIQAPKSRLIVPQVHAIRDALDNEAMCLVTKADGYEDLIKQLQPRPALVICDSQVVDVMTEFTPPEIPCTTFSILFSRLKGDLNTFLSGCSAIDTLQDGDLILIAEACTHHATCEDIGRVKIPRLLERKTGRKLQFEFASGRDFPADISQFKLIVHCGSCMLNRKETLWRIRQAAAAGVPITNYGMAISHCQGVLSRAVMPVN